MKQQGKKGRKEKSLELGIELQKREKTFSILHRKTMYIQGKKKSKDQEERGVNTCSWWRIKIRMNELNFRIQEQGHTNNKHKSDLF